jgi:hypothetical protein
MARTIHTSINLNYALKEEIERLAKEDHVSFNAKMNQLIELGLDKSGKLMNVTESLKDIKECQTNNYVVLSSMINLVYLMFTNMTREKTGIDYMKVYSELKNNGKFYDFLEILENEVENR